MGNPFLATGRELITLDTRAVMDDADAVAVSLSKIHEVGQVFHKEYVNTRLDKVTVPLVRHNQEKQHVHIRHPS